MRRLGHSRPENTNRLRGSGTRGTRLEVGAAALTVVMVLLPMAPAQTGITREDGKWTRTITGTAAAAPRLRVNAHGPVTLEAGTGGQFTYTIKVSVEARSEAEARRLLNGYAVRTEAQQGWMVFTAPAGQVMAATTVRAPRLNTAVITTSEGGVHAFGVAGALSVDTGAGELACDRIGGDCKLVTGGGDIDVGVVGGWLRSRTDAGHIRVKTVRGEATLETQGGDITAGEIGGLVRAETGGGGVRINNAGGAVTAVSGGGELVVEKAGGTVTLRNMGGPVRVGSAAGVACESAGGGIKLTNIAGPMRVSTTIGSIMATLMGGKLADSFIATGNGDITVLIPSNLSVTVQAQNNMADTLRRIVSEFPAIQARRQGTRIIAQGALNGGGPLLQISGMGGTIFIKRQQ